MLVFDKFQNLGELKKTQEKEKHFISYPYISQNIIRNRNPDFY